MNQPEVMDTHAKRTNVRLLCMNVYVDPFGPPVRFFWGQYTQIPSKMFPLVPKTRLQTFRTAVPFRGQVDGLSPKRDCGSKKGWQKPLFLPFDIQHTQCMCVFFTWNCSFAYPTTSSTASVRADWSILLLRGGPWWIGPNIVSKNTREYFEV